MVKILRPGNSAKRIICGHCQAELEYRGCDIEEATTEQYVSHQVRTTITEYITCPDCGKRIVLGERYGNRKLPHLVGESH